MEPSDDALLALEARKLMTLAIYTNYKKRLLNPLETASLLITLVLINWTR